MVYNDILMAPNKFKGKKYKNATVQSWHSGSLMQSNAVTGIGFESQELMRKTGKSIILIICLLKRSLIFPKQSRMEIGFIPS